MTNERHHVPLIFQHERKHALHGCEILNRSNFEYLALQSIFDDDVCEERLCGHLADNENKILVLDMIFQSDVLAF